MISSSNNSRDVKTKNADNNQAFRVVLTGGGTSDPGGITIGLPFSWDAFTVDRTSATENIYNYTLSAIPTGTVTITYTDSTKCEISGGSIVSI